MIIIPARPNWIKLWVCGEIEGNDIINFASGANNDFAYGRSGIVRCFLEVPNLFLDDFGGSLGFQNLINVETTISKVC
jgi:hypothetical protein